MSKDKKAKKKECIRALQHFTGVPWAITEDKLREIQALIMRKSMDDAWFAGPFDNGSPFEAKARPAASVQGGVQVLNVFGVVAQRMDMFSQMSGGTSTEKLTKDFRSAVNDPSIKAIVLNIDSPGGTVFGVQELADEIYSARANKHVVAVSNSMAASAAYWIGSAADEFVVTPSGQVGSIGVYTMHQDLSKLYEEMGINTTFIQAGKYKTEGNSLQPLSDEARASMQDDVNFYYDAFVGAVAKGRGVTSSVVKNTYGQGRMLNSRDAKAAGMVDRVDTLDGVLTRLGVNTNSSTTTMKSLHAETAGRELDLLLK